MDFTSIGNLFVRSGRVIAVRVPGGDAEPVVYFDTGLSLPVQDETPAAATLAAQNWVLAQDQGAAPDEAAAD